MFRNLKSGLQIPEVITTLSQTVWKLDMLRINSESEKESNF